MQRGKPRVALLFACAILMTGARATESTQPDPGPLRARIEAMKRNPRGPFDAIRWFCKDGAILMPEPGACKPHGGGHQHGQWSASTRELRAAGYFIANVFADLDVPALLAADPTFLPVAQMVIEQYLVRVDDGWILRQARYYRGAYQEEGERAGTRSLLVALAATPDATGWRYLLLRTAVAALPHGKETATVREVRQLAADLSERDPGFKALRNKIHGRLEAGDAATVRAYADAGAADTMKPDLARLADLIAQVHASDLAATLTALKQKAATLPTLQRSLDETLAALPANPSSTVRHALTARILTELRQRLTDTDDARLRLAMLDTSLAVEAEHIAAAGDLRAAIPTFTRAERLALADASVDALFGVGLVSARQRDAAHTERSALAAASVSVQSYKRALDYLALMPHWATQSLHLQFGVAMAKLAGIEPKAGIFIQDQLRGSPLLFQAELVDGLLRDANRLAGVRNELFGDDVGSGLRGLNPGLARGMLRVAANAESGAFDRNEIYLLPATVSDLPPVAGILTAGEGNPLSHVQLLARNLGIPNVAFDQRLLERLRAHADGEVVLAVSPRGSVRIAAASTVPDAVFSPADTPAGAPRIQADLAKLDLGQRDFIALDVLRASDSGRIVGPKAAKLGELKHHYPDKVAKGIAIPFGAFRALLDQPMTGEAGSVFDWMQAQYRALAAMPADAPGRRDATEAFRAQLQRWIAQADPGADFRNELRTRLEETFGPDGSYGVFVRSDTNVEDLPGFTGAGLNLTLPNVVGVDAIMRAIAEVWASPFSARSFAWRQSLMDEPEHVYPAVLLLGSVDNEKSGVLVTQDIDGGDRGWLSLAVNEGVGGAVDGQSAESLRIERASGRVRLLAQATAPFRRQLDPHGGIVERPVSGRDAVLAPTDISQLLALAGELPDRFPPIVDAAGRPAPADIEFGFREGRLQLFQIRPFLDNAQARGATYLTEMDRDYDGAQGPAVSLEAIPSQGGAPLGATASTEPAR